MIYTAASTLVMQVAVNYGFRADLLAAQIQIESSGDPFAFRYEKAFFDRYIHNHASAQGYKFGPLAACSFGLLQILLETAIEQGFTDRPERLFDPRTGLTWGAKYLQTCLAASDGDYRKALARYNGAGKLATVYADKVFAQADTTAAQ